MKKNWSYVAAMMLIAASGVGLTGCIDNDEPKGIYEIRVATANLLEAKKAAAEAEAAASKLELELKQLDLEIEKAKIEAQKQKDAAQAEIDKLLAESQAAINQAKADSIAKAAEANLKWVQAQIDDLVADTKIKVDKANLKYEMALYQFEQMKLKNAHRANESLYRALESTYKAYLIQLKAYNTANYNYMMAQHEYSKMLTDLKWNGSEFVSPNYNQKKVLEANVEYYQKEIQKQNKTITEWTDFIASVKDIQASDLYKLLESYKEKDEKNDAAIEQNKVDKAELEINNKALYDSRKTLSEEATQIYIRQNPIPEYTYEPDAALSKVPGFEAAIPIIPEGWSFSLQDLKSNGGYSYYAQAVDKYTNEISKLKNALLDDNDVAWTNARIAEMGRMLEAANGAYNENKANWETSKKAFNNGGVPDATVLPNADEVKTTYDAYIAAASEFAALRQAVIDTREAMTKAWDDSKEAREAFGKDPNTVQAKYDAAVETHDAAMDAANQAWATATANAAAKRDQIIRDEQEKERVAAAAAFRAEQEYNLVLSQNNYDTENAAVKAAKSAWDAKEATYAQQQTATSQAITKAHNDYALAEQKADTAKLKAYHTADEALDKARTAYVAANGSDQTSDPLYAPVAAANLAYQEASEKYSKAMDAAINPDAKNAVREKYWPLNTAVSKQKDAINEMGCYSWNTGEIWDLYYALNSYLNGSSEDTTFPTGTLPADVMDPATGRYTNVYNLLVATSQLAYGNLGIDYDENSGEWEVDEAYLIEVNQKVIDSYIKAETPNRPEYQYYLAYQYDFGSYGKVLYYNNRIDVAKAYVANNDLIPDAVKPLEDNLATLEKSAEDVEAEYAAKMEEWDLANEKISDLEKANRDEANELGWYASNYSKIISAINSAIAAIESPIEIPGGSAGWSGDAEAMMKLLIEEANSEITQAEETIANQEKLLADAQYQLDQYNNSYSKLENPYLYTVEYYKSLAEGEKAKLDSMKSRLDALQAAYDKATGTTTEGGEEAE